MSENLNLKTISTIDPSPFRHLCVTIGELPSAFIESMSYYELLAWFVNYLENTVIPAVNANGEATAELQEKFIELKTFVDTYFENLDVQEEINNKLDEMADEGTLQEIITTYIQSNVAWTFDTVADMKLATNLVDGSYAQTLGFHSLSDGGGATYKIVNTATANEKDVIAVGSLFAVLIPNPTILAEQLGAYGDGTHDDTTILQYAFSNYKHIGLTKTYKITDTIYPESNNIIDGFNTGIIYAAPYEDVEHILIFISEKENITIKDIEIKSDNSYIAVDGSDHPNWNNTLSSNLDGCHIQRGSNNITIDNVRFTNMYKDITANSDDEYGDNTDLTFRNIVSTGSANTPIVIGRVNGCLIDNVDVTKNALCVPATHFVYTFKNGAQNLIINNCRFKGNEYMSVGLQFYDTAFTPGTTTFKKFNIICNNTIVECSYPLALKNRYIDLVCNDCKFIQLRKLKQNQTYVYSGFILVGECDDSKYVFNNCRFECEQTETTNDGSLIAYPTSNTAFEEYFEFNNCEISSGIGLPYNMLSKKVDFNNCYIHTLSSLLYRSKAGTSILLNDCNINVDTSYVFSTGGSATETITFKDCLITALASGATFVAGNANSQLNLYNNVIYTPNRLTNNITGDYATTKVFKNNTLINDALIS